MMKILITGGKGFLGSVFTKLFQDKYEIVALGSKDLDISDRESVITAITAHRPQIVMHLAAKAETKFCQEHPERAYDINVNGAIFVAEACRQIGAKMLFASTEQIFNGNTEEGPYTESSQPVPNTIYGQNKWDAEQALQEILEELWILRFTWIFGLPEHGIKLPAEILFQTIKSILSAQEISVATNEYRGMSYIYEIAQNIEKVFEIPFGSYHFGSENPLERYEVVRYIAGLIGQEHYPVLKVPNPYGARRDVRLDCSKIQSYGIHFSDTPLAIEKCLKEFGYIL